MSAFPQTRSTVVRELRSGEPEVYHRAVDRLVAAYWKPVYFHLRLRWNTPHADAQDLTQEFFLRLLEKRYLDRYDAARARFRTFLRLCLDRFIANQKKASGRLKRGGAESPLSLDFAGAEREVSQLESEFADPETRFHREWVRSLFALAVEDLRRRCVEVGKPTHFALFQRYDLDDANRESLSYQDLAEAYQLPVTQVTNHLAWARREFRRLLLDRLRHLCGSEREFRAEAKELLGLEVA
jgi:RNA polymerase sigma factor (sigma-70 family)